MSSFSTRWSISREHPVRPEDLDADGSIADRAVVAWIEEARDRYLEQCEELERARAAGGLTLRDRGGARPAGAGLGSASSVAVSASATEVHPRSFTVAVRIRPLGGDRDDPLNAACVMALEDPATGEAHEITSAIRDELIALEHAARHFN